MTVKELKKELRTLDGELPVYFYDGNYDEYDPIFRVELKSLYISRVDGTSTKEKTKYTKNVKHTHMGACLL